MPILWAQNIMIKTHTSKSAFTIVELVVSIAVIGILAAVTLVSYGAWRTSTTTAAVRSNLVQAAATMESSRTFNNGYPATIPTSFVASNDVQVTLQSSDPRSFCIDGTSLEISTIKYYIDNLNKTNDVGQGTCATRTALPPIGKVVNVTVVASSGTLTVNWVNPTPNYALQYLVVCAKDAGFSDGLVQNQLSGATTTNAVLTGGGIVNGITYYCHVKAVNGDRQGDWSTTVSS